MIDKLNSVIELNAEKAERLRTFSGVKVLHIKKQVELLLSHIGDMGIFSEYTKHNISHIEEMLKLAEWVIPEETQKIMTSSEWMMLVLSIYFHDMGMIVTKKEFENRDNSDFTEYKKKVYEGFGEMLFTHFGVSGPLILSASSSYVKKYKGQQVSLCIDLKPALTREQLDKRLLRDFEENKNRQFKNSLEGLLPSKMIPVMVELSGIVPEKRVNEITREERSRLVELFKNLEMTVTGTRGFQEAIVTQGGVHVKEINPGTMESKMIKGLYFAGEVLDLDALTGGFNLQIAWSTGYLAGSSAAESE